MLALYLIEILHQTTTLPVASSPAVWLYLIEILHQTTTQSTVDRNSAALYLIEILHQTTTLRPFLLPVTGCILSKFYIKPQPHKATSGGQDVVSYRNSTSNHNKEGGQLFGSGVVSYRNSTSNHNFFVICVVLALLYLIEILHQTTTNEDSFLFCYTLYLIEILHQTTTRVFVLTRIMRCILSKFYIKPQHRNSKSSAQRVVSYRNSTSNHNSPNGPLGQQGVVSYRNSTSNHN